MLLLNNQDNTIHFVTLPQVLAQSSLRARKLLVSKKASREREGAKLHQPRGYRSGNLREDGRDSRQALLNDSTDPDPLPEIALTAS